MGSADPKGGMHEMYDGFMQHLGPNVRIFALEYRLSSAAPFPAANPFPASVLDGLAGYRYLVQDCGFSPDKIIFAGDSAGGGIALNLARYLATANLPGLPVPAGLLLLSPTVDWAQTHTGPGSSMVTNSASDFVHPIFESGYTAKALLGSLPEEMVATSAWFSPGSKTAESPKGTYAGMPATLLVAGGGEYSLDPMKVTAERMQADMGEDKFTFLEVPDATHDFLLHSWSEPERTSTLKEVATWAGGVWA